MSPVFIQFHKLVSEGKANVKQELNFTKFQFHIGHTTVRVFANPNTRIATYTLFENDGFWDPDFIDEKVNKSFSIGSDLIPDGKGPNLERFGTPYNYNPTIISIPFY